MKLKMILIFSLFFIGFLIANTSQAGKEACPSDTVHCAYFYGDFTKGRWIKVNGPVNFIYCFKQTNYISFFASSAKSHIGFNSNHYAICADEYGKNCKSLGVDGFTISVSDNFYYANPKYYAIDVSQIADQYPSCGN